MCEGRFRGRCDESIGHVLDFTVGRIDGLELLLIIEAEKRLIVEGIELRPGFVTFQDDIFVNDQFEFHRKLKRIAAWQQKEGIIAGRERTR